MANGFLLRSAALAASNFGGASYSTVGINAAFPVANLANPQPKVVVQTNAYAGGTPRTMVEIDLGADTSIDTVIAMHATCGPSMTWRIFGANNATGMPAINTEGAGLQLFGFTAFQAFGQAPTTRLIRRGAVAAGNPVSVRYIRVYFEEVASTNPYGLFSLGTLAVGRRLQPAFNFEFGSGRRIQDRSTIRELPGGELGRNLAARVPITRVTWGDLTDAELRTLWSLLLDIGEAEPLFLCEDPDPVAGQNEGLHYGTLQGLDFWERAMADKSRIELRLREWL